MALWWSCGGEAFFMSEVPQYAARVQDVAWMQRPDLVRKSPTRFTIHLQYPTVEYDHSIKSQLLHAISFRDFPGANLVAVKISSQRNP